MNAAIAAFDLQAELSLARLSAWEYNQSSIDVVSGGLISVAVLAWLTRNEERGLKLAVYGHFPRMGLVAECTSAS